MPMASFSWLYQFLQTIIQTLDDCGTFWASTAINIRRECRRWMTTTFFLGVNFNFFML
jgi:hypothetical protein